MRVLPRLPEIEVPEDAAVRTVLDSPRVKSRLLIAAVVLAIPFFSLTLRSFSPGETSPAPPAHTARVTEPPPAVTTSQEPRFDAPAPATLPAAAPATRQTLDAELAHWDSLIRALEIEAARAPEAGRAPLQAAIAQLRAERAAYLVAAAADPAAARP